jgi:hypothetical protein
VDSSRSRRRWPTLLAVAGLLMATGCVATSTPSAGRIPTLEAPFVSLSPLPDPTPSEPESTAYSAPPVGARALAERFAFAFLTYDTRTENVRGFLERVRPLTTPVVVRALSRSPRSRLPWAVMLSRNEKASLTVTGTSVASTGNRLTLHVNGITTTHTNLAVLRSPVQLRLHIANTREGWKVTGVHGGGS